MVKVFLGLGSNVERHRYLAMGLDALADCFGELEISSVYESDAVGFVGDRFLNLVVALATEMPLAELARQLRVIEHAHGRPPGGPKFSPRTLDIDILLYGDYCGRSGTLVLPRDEIDRYAFVLRPLAELAPDAIHPFKGICYRDLWTAMAEAQGDLLVRVPFRWRDRDY